MQRALGGSLVEDESSLKWYNQMVNLQDAGTCTWEGERGRKGERERDWIQMCSYTQVSLQTTAVCFSGDANISLPQILWLPVAFWLINRVPFAFSFCLEVLINPALICRRSRQWHISQIEQLHSGKLYKRKLSKARRAIQKWQVYSLQDITRGTKCSATHLMPFFFLIDAWILYFIMSLWCRALVLYLFTRISNHL